MTNKNPKTKTIEVSIEIYDKLCSISDSLEEIFKHNVTFNDVLRVVLCPKIVDYSELTLKNVVEPIVMVKE